MNKNKALFVIATIINIALLFLTISTIITLEISLSSKVRATIAVEAICMFLMWLTYEILWPK